MSANVTVDLVTYDPKRDAFVLVVVEQGPWPADAIEPSLRRLQNTLSACIDAAVDGGVAQKYPESGGKLVVILLDCYDTPRDQSEQMLFRVAEYAHSSADIQRAINEKRYVGGLDFEFNWRQLPKDA